MLSLGVPNTLQNPLKPRSDEFEMSQIGPHEYVPLPVARAGLSYGNGDSVADKYPGHLEDGMILARMNPSRYTTDQKEALLMKTDQLFDFAADAVSGPIYVVFTNQQGYQTSGLENILHTYDKTSDPWTPNFTGSTPIKPVYDAKYDPGLEASYSVNGIMGSGEAWIGARLTQELSLSAYTVGDWLTVSKGKYKRAVTGNFAIAQVEYKITKDSRTKIRIRFFTTPVKI